MVAKSVGEAREWLRAWLHLTRSERKILEEHAKQKDVLAMDEEGNPIGAARMLSDGRIGRMAMLKEHRGYGIGRALLEALLAEARARQLRKVSLAAQIHAIPFYQKYGFQIRGGEFLDAGIPHRLMVLTLPA